MSAFDDDFDNWLMHGFEDYDEDEEHILDRTYWRCADDREIPIGKMTESHIRAVMNFIQKPEYAESLQHNEPWLCRLSQEEYITSRIKESILWLQLTKALERFEDLKKKANDINKGVLEL